MGPHAWLKCKSYCESCDRVWKLCSLGSFLPRFSQSGLFLLAPSSTRPTLLWPAICLPKSSQLPRLSAAHLKSHRKGPPRPEESSHSLLSPYTLPFIRLLRNVLLNAFFPILQRDTTVSETPSLPKSQHSAWHTATTLNVLAKA